MSVATGRLYQTHSKAKTKQNRSPTQVSSPPCSDVHLTLRVAKNTDSSEARNLTRQRKASQEVIRPSLIYPLREFKFSHLTAPYEDILFLFLTLSLGFFHADVIAHK